MSTRFATSPDSGHSVPRTTPRGQAKPTKSSPVRKVYPNNREQYQKFGYDDSFLLPAFDDKSKFFNFLGVNPLGPELTVPDMPLRGMKYFLTLANEVAEFIKDEREDYLFLYLAFLTTCYFHFRFPRVRNPSV